MSTYKRIETLNITAISVLVSPFTWWLFAHNAGLKEIMFFGFPLVVLAGRLLFVSWKQSEAGEMEKAQFIGHLVGSILYFIPYYCFGLYTLNSANAPQGPGILLVPLSAPLALYVLYKPGYLFVTKILYPSVADVNNNLQGRY